MSKPNTKGKSGPKVIGVSFSYYSSSLKLHTDINIGRALSNLKTALQTLGYKPRYHTITHFLPNARSQAPIWLKAI